MLNQTVMVGRLAADPEIKKEGEKTLSTITLAIPRSFKNADGEYDTDFVECILWNGIAENTKEYCRKGDIVGVKGRLQTERIENEDGIVNYKMNVIAEKVTFLSNKKVDDSQED